jgi:hypothetical protein
MPEENDYPGYPEGSTFVPFKLDPQRYKDLGFSDLVTEVFGRLSQFTVLRRTYYDNRRGKITDWASLSRKTLAALAALAFLLTAAAAAVPAAYPDWSRAALIGALLVYAVMGAILIYERATDTTGSYFRYILAILTLRDLWTKLEFEVLKELEKAKKANDATTAEQSARDQILALAEAYCVDVDKVTTTEATEWRTAFQASMGALEEVAKKGSENVLRRIEENVKAAEKAATEARATAESLRPGQMNVSIKGNFEGEVTLLVDGTEAARSSARSIGLGDIRVGVHKIVARSSIGGRPVETSMMVDVKPGIQPLEVTF